MRLLQWTKRGRKSKISAPLETSKDVIIDRVALAGAVFATAQTKAKPFLTVSKAKIPLTCERLDEAGNRLPMRSSGVFSPNDETSTPVPTAEKLVSLLSRLPYEIRLNIYELCIPCMWHRKRRVLLDYIVDCEWMATSPAIFSEAAPLVLTKSLPFIYTKLSEGQTLAGVFDKHIERAFPKDFQWALPAARSMIEILAVPVRCPFFYKDGEDNDLGQRLQAFFETTQAFPNLKTLQISLGPDFFPVRAHRAPIFADDWEGEIEHPMVQKLEASAIALKQVIPRTCEVIWRFDKAAMPTTYSNFGGKRDATLRYLRDINVTMEKAWSQEGFIERIGNIELRI